MQARLSPAGPLIRLIDCIKEQVGVLLITAKKEELCFESRSIVREVECRGRLESGFFQGYMAADICRIGLEAGALGRVLRLAQIEDSVELIYSGGETIRVLIETESGGKNVEFELKTVADLSDELPSQSSNFLALVDLPALEFSRLCKGLAQLSDSVTIEVTCKDVRLVVAGDMGGGQVSLRGLLLREVISKEVRCEVSLGLLVQFNRAAALSDTVTVRLYGEATVQLTYTWPYGTLSFFTS